MRQPYGTRRTWWLMSALMAAVLTPSKAAYGRNICTSTRLGAGGAWHVPVAGLCEERLLSFGLAGSYASASGLTLATDSWQQWTYGLHAVWTVVPAWQVGLRVQEARSELTLPGRTQLRTGRETELFAKYSFFVWDAIMGAAMLQLSTPGAAPASEASDAYQLGLMAAVPAAGTVTPQLSLTWRPAWLDTTLNLGYAFDNSARLLSGAATAEQAAGMNIAAGNRVLVQLAVSRDFATRIPWLAAMPFLETGAALPGGNRVKHSAAWLTLGGKALLGVNRFLEVTLGVDIGLTGLAPAPTDIPTVPAVQVFLQAVINIERLTGTAPPCKAECPAPVATPPRVVMIADANRLTKPLPGLVVDADTGAAVSAARIHIAGLEAVLVADPHAGTFATWPLDTNQPSYTWTAYAPGYLAASQTIDPRTWPASKPIRIAMQANKGVAPLNVRGIVRDGQTGEPIAGKVFLPETGTVITCGADGAFAASLRPGHLEIMVSAPGYLSQKRSFEGDEGETIILNVDLSRKRKHHRGAPAEPNAPVEAPAPAPGEQAAPAPEEQPASP